MARKSSKVVAEICLYGSHQHGTGWLASIPSVLSGKQLGDGELRPSWSMTHAVWLACESLTVAGLAGKARVFAPGGRLCGLVDIDRPCYFGEIAWEPAPVFVVSAEAIEAAASR